MLERALSSNLNAENFFVLMPSCPHAFVLCIFELSGMLVYRTCTCCRRIYGKLVHSLFHLLAVPCIVIAFLAVWDYKSRR